MSGSVRGGHQGPLEDYVNWKYCYKCGDGFGAHFFTRINTTVPTEKETKRETYTTTLARHSSFALAFDISFFAHEGFSHLIAT